MASDYYYKNSFWQKTIRITIILGHQIKIDLFKKFYFHLLQIEEINGTDFVIDDDGYVVVYSDGACPFNGQDQARGGIGVWFGYQHEL